MKENFFNKLLNKARENAALACLHLADGSTRTYAQVFDRAGQYARTLQALGVGPGDRVAVQVEKSAENLTLYLGTLQAGAVYVPLNTAYTREEVAYFLGDAEPALFVGGAADAELASRFPGIRCLTLDAQGQGTLVDEVNRHQPLATVVPRETTDLAAIVYTSGTTGRSKGAMLCHGNLAMNAEALIEAWGWQASDVLLHALPIFHVHGLFIAMHCALGTGTPMIFLPKFVGAETLRWLNRATVLMGVPTFYTRLLGESGLTAESVRHMRVFISGSAPLTPQTFAEFETRTGHRILERYGMSETIINTTNPLVGERVPGTVGYALPGVEVRIADAAGVEVPRGEVGMIEVRGGNVFSGYWRMPDKTREEIRADGFFITGDLGTMAADGRVAIVGRGKDLVISGGYNVYPKEIEEALDDIPGVRESAVIGVPHADFGEAVVAIVVPDGEPLDLEQLRPHLADRLAKFKQPKALFNVGELPRNTMGKVQKNILRDTYRNTFRAE
ncbi:MAG: AMP-binding protein [Pseudomonadales bacterium]|nr:AMP-binding protein [Pseudomonadales bacterium]MCP5184805.1 AMP-binding protein [Pseudomonadales bacterium]